MRAFMDADDYEAESAHAADVREIDIERLMERNGIGYDHAAAVVDRVTAFVGRRMAPLAPEQTCALPSAPRMTFEEWDNYLYQKDLYT